jgi:aspartate aminotransferase-like enzyme
MVMEANKSVFDRAATLAPLGYRLRLPGPTDVPEQIREALARPITNHRGPEFRALLAQVESRLQPLFGTANRVLIYSCSGTGMMEASLANIVVPGDRVLVIVHGQFGERYASIGKALGAHVETIEFPWGEGIDPAAIEDRLHSTHYHAVVAIHNESSTGCVADLAAIGRLLRDRSTLFLVDSVSGLGGIEMCQDEWGVDIVVSASQKALMCPPGLAFASISAKAWAVVNRETSAPRFYFDFRRALSAIEGYETAFTPAVSLVAALGEALGMIHSEGLPAVLQRHQRLSFALRAGGLALGLQDFSRGAIKSNTVVVFEMPETVKGGDVVRAMYERYSTVIAGARNRLAGRVIRFGTMGYLTESTILTDLFYLENVLREFGLPVQAGSGVAAATAYLSSSTTGSGAAHLARVQ